MSKNLQPETLQKDDQSPGAAFESLLKCIHSIASQAQAKSIDMAAAHAIYQTRRREYVAELQKLDPSDRERTMAGLAAMELTAYRRHPEIADMFLRRSPEARASTSLMILMVSAPIFSIVGWYASQGILAGAVSGSLVTQLTYGIIVSALTGLVASSGLSSLYWKVSGTASLKKKLDCPRQTLSAAEQLLERTRAERPQGMQKTMVQTQKAGTQPAGPYFPDKPPSPLSVEGQLYAVMMRENGFKEAPPSPRLPSDSGDFPIEQQAGGRGRVD